MTDLAKRFAENPLLSPRDIGASDPRLRVACLLNPGAFEFENKVYLIVRVAERPEQADVKISFPIINAEGKTDIVEIPLDDADLIASDARVIRYKGIDYLTTLSHLRIFESPDGIHFTESTAHKRLFGKTALESFGIEDCRVTKIDPVYYLTYTAVSENGVGVGMKSTEDWKDIKSHGMIMPPHNKDFTLFPEMINGFYYALHRPTTLDNQNNIWIAESRDVLHWGNHKCLLKTRSGHWDSARVGAGAAPIKTAEGWLHIYHGADAKHRYCLGAVLFDLKDPTKILSRSIEPIMEPSAPYELAGFFGHVVFTNGHILNGDKLTVYYGAADALVCGAEFSVSEILKSLK